MRQVSVIALVASSLSLAACAGGGNLASGTLSAAGTCASTLVVDASACQSQGGGGTPPTTPTGGANNGNNGNNTNLPTGDTAIALESGNVVTPKAKPALSKLTLTTAPNTAKFEIDTNTANNQLWAVPKTMDEYVAGTNASGGVGLGGTYKEYRVYNKSAAGPNYDEVLQVWTFDHSYALQYRDETSGAEVADKQAWAFGALGTSVVTPGTAIPASRATATYNGRFGSTAITSNWAETDTTTQTVSHNNSWRVNGAAAATVDFSASTVNATLTPELWRTEMDMNNNGNTSPVDVLVSNPADPNYAGFMSSEIKLSGTLTSTLTGNSINGSATMDSADGWLSDGTSNPFYGALFGNDAQEITGVFAASATSPGPIGGTVPINNPKRGYIQHSGAFNACDPVCPP